MARTIELNETKTIEIVAAQTGSADKITEVRIILDDGGCVIASWNFAGKSFNQTIWDETTTPSYLEVGQWTDDDVDNRLKQITFNL